IGGELDRLAGGIRPGARDHRDAPGGMLDRGPDQQTVLIEIDGGRLAGGADDNDAVGALPHMPVDETAEALEIESPVLEHGGYDGDDAAPEHGVSPPSKNAEF